MVAPIELVRFAKNHSSATKFKSFLRMSTAYGLWFSNEPNQTDDNPDPHYINVNNSPNNVGAFEETYGNR